VIPICLTCGCRSRSDHGDDDNITWDDLKDAADEAGIDPETAAINLLSATEHEVDKGAQWSGRVVKADAVNRVAVMVAYSCNKMPHRGADGFKDVVSPETLEKACWRFMENGAAVNLHHEGGYQGDAHIVENSIYRNPVPWVIKATDGTKQVVRKGDWVVAVRFGPEEWDMFEKGLIGGASPEGDCRRVPARPETLARLRSDA
jgi:hypothetical protein